jgi:hypothetical protein
MSSSSALDTERTKHKAAFTHEGNIHVVNNFTDTLDLKRSKRNPTDTSSVHVQEFFIETTTLDEEVTSSQDSADESDECLDRMTENQPPQTLKH